MTLPPPSQPPGPSPSPDPDPASGYSRDQGPHPDQGPYPDLAALDPDVEGLDLAVPVERHEPSDAELAGLDPGPADDREEQAAPWLAAAASGLGASFSEGGVLDGLGPGAALAGFSQYALDDGLAALPDDALEPPLRPDPRPRPNLHLPRLPPPCHQLRLGPHHPLPPRRPHLPCNLASLCRR
jgi:hypothetical protein